MALIDPRSFFKDAYSFPWEFIGMTRPFYGPCHSYICEAMAKYYKEPLRTFLECRPALFEIKRMARAIEGPNICNEIFNYCEELGKANVGNNVVRFLAGQPLLVADLSKIADTKFKEGIIDVDHEHLTFEGTEWKKWR